MAQELELYYCGTIHELQGTNTNRSGTEQLGKNHFYTVPQNSTVSSVLYEIYLNHLNILMMSKVLRVRNSYQGLYVC